MHIRRYIWVYTGTHVYTHIYEEIHTHMYTCIYTHTPMYEHDKMLHFSSNFKLKYFSSILDLV